MNNIPEDIIPAGHVYIRESVLEKANIFGISGDRSEWAKNLNLPREGECIFFAGCGYQFMKYAGGMMQAVRSMGKTGVGMGRLIGLSKAFGKVGVDLPSITGKIAAVGREDPYTRILTSAVNVLRKLGVNPSFLHEDEPCCGSPLYYAGFVDDYARNASRNYSVFKSAGVKKVIGLVPACTASLRDIYPKFVDGYDLEVKHFIQVVAQRLRETNIKPKLREKLTVTYHDPCQLSRYLGIVHEPREIMAKIEGLEVREPETEQRGGMVYLLRGRGRDRDKCPRVVRENGSE